MFEKYIYTKRREELRKKISDGILLFPGNNESPMNYRANTYHFRQDSSFLYYFGLDFPDFCAVCDIDEERDIIYADDLTIKDIIWMGNQASVSERAAKAGVTETFPSRKLKEDIQGWIKSGRRVHILPPYRDEHLIFLSNLLNISINETDNFISDSFIKAVVSMREIKDEHEICQIEQAVDTAYKMHTTVMKMAHPGTWEREIAGIIEGIALANGGPVSFPVILSMNGEILHNNYHGNLLKEGRLLVTDAGCESSLHYASDITRTVPVGGKFSQKQKEIYEIVLKANINTIEAVKPGIRNHDLHLQATEIITEGLKELGLMKGDTEEAIMAGAHALFFPHGLGHMLGLDVHDMENLGEKNVGYDDTSQRSEQFGLSSLRFAKTLKPGFVFTIEPGIYFIPALIELWKKEKKNMNFINFSKLESYMDFGGIRVEDNILVTDSGSRILGKPIPKSVVEIEELMRVR